MRILSLNGGGTAGYASCLVLEQLEADIGKACWEIFDLMAGVSTGAIIAGGLGIGLSASDLVKFYETEIPIIFKKSSWQFWRGYIGSPKYDSAPLEKALNQVFGYSFISGCKTRCMIHATQIAPQLKPFFWKSWIDCDPLVDILRASSAVPTFFAPKNIGPFTFVDGAIVANNPSHCAVAEAIKIGAKLEDISLLNLQLNDAPIYSQEQADGLQSIFDWAFPISDVMLNSNVDISEYITETLVPGYLNVDFNFPQAIDFWSDEFAASIRQRVESYWRLNGQAIVSRIKQGTKATGIQNDSDSKGSHASNQVYSRVDH